VARIYAHLTTCQACQGLADAERTLDRLLEERLTQRPASPALKRRLQARLPATAAPVQRPRARWLVPVAGAVAACAVVVVVGLRRDHLPTDRAVADPLVAEAIADHLRVVYRDRPVDIESGGPHQVRPWFTGRLDFALPAVFGGDQEFTLEGGSVGYYLDRKAAVLVYRGGCTRRRPGLPRRPARLSDSQPRSRRYAGSGAPGARLPGGGLAPGPAGYALVSDLTLDEIIRLGSLIHESRSDWAQLLTSLYLIVVGPGRWSLDAFVHRRRESGIGAMASDLAEPLSQPRYRLTRKPRGICLVYTPSAARSAGASDAAVSVPMPVSLGASIG
jgi:anti-sigma factor RsiW